jgi:PAS domain S-box-containing protein
MSSTHTAQEQRKTLLKKIIKQLHDGASVDEVKDKFREFFATCSPLEISQIEEELIKEGMPVEDIRELCDVHLAVFQEALESSSIEVDPGHPIHILLEEHKLLLGFAQNLHSIAKSLDQHTDYNEALTLLNEAQQIVTKIQDSENHYLREENVLFPYLEKQGITQPPAIMWTEHDKIREIKKALYTLIDTREQIEFKRFTSELNKLTLALAEMLASHFYKENNILFPTGLQVIGEDEWVQIRRDFDDIGYTCFTPDPATFFYSTIKEDKEVQVVEGLITFETGSLEMKTLEAILNTLPVDITFVDKDDRVRYFSGSKERIFVRSKAVLGRTVQNCHPKKSLDKVEQILQDFKAGKRDKAEFWINLADRLIYIRYFPVHNPEGEYLGCLEVSQDITAIKKIEGEKRLLS